MRLKRASKPRPWIEHHAIVPLWGRRWWLFFLATTGLFGYANDNEWGMSHYRLIPVGS